MKASEKLQEMKSEYALKVAQFDEVLSMVATDIKAAEDAAYDQGLRDAGVKSEDKIYTEADLQAEIAKSLEVQAAEITSLKSKIEALESAPPVDVEAVKAAAKAEVKAELLAKYEEQQVAEQQGETGFKDLLG